MLWLGNWLAYVSFPGAFQHINVFLHLSHVCHFLSTALSFDYKPHCVSSQERNDGEILQCCNARRPRALWCRYINISYRNETRQTQTGQELSVHLKHTDAYLCAESASRVYFLEKSLVAPLVPNE